jgi:hypothetical protein
VIGVVLLIPRFFLSPQMWLDLAAILLGVGRAPISASPSQAATISNSRSSSPSHSCLRSRRCSAWGSAPGSSLRRSWAHGLWDFAHHNRANLRLVSIPQWYIPWCVIIDCIVGIGLIVIWRWNGVLQG